MRFVDRSILLFLACISINVVYAMDGGEQSIANKLKVAEKRIKKLKKVIDMLEIENNLLKRQLNNRPTPAVQIPVPFAAAPAPVVQIYPPIRREIIDVYSTNKVEIDGHLKILGFLDLNNDSALKALIKKRFLSEDEKTQLISILIRRHGFLAQEANRRLWYLNNAFFRLRFLYGI